jgi:hypothetical protein
MWCLHAGVARRLFGSCSVAAVLLIGETGLAGVLHPGTRLCLHPVRLPITDWKDDPRTHSIQTKLVGTLETQGFEVADPDVVDAIVTRIDADIGGTIDPYTGRRDPQRHQARLSALGDALRTQLGCEARMLAHVEPVWAFFTLGSATWDGTTERVSSVGRVALQVLGGAYELGHVRGFSLWLRVLDLEGRQITFRSAGIELLVQLAVIKEQELLPEDQWLRDEAKIDAAILSALGRNGGALRRKGDPHLSPRSR